MAERRRRPSVARFTNFLRALTLLGLPPVAIAVLEASRRFGPFVSAALSILVCSAVLWGIGPRVRLGFADARRPDWVGRLALPLFDAVWCACLFSPLTTALTAAVALPLSLLRPSLFGLAPIAQAGTALALVVSVYGVLVRRRWVRIRRLEVTLPSLPASLDGFRLVHLSDLHVGSIDRARDARRWAEMANALQPDLVAVTGDLLSTGSEFHDEVTEVLGALRARHGVYACLGNHDYYEEDALCARLEEVGVRVLRNEGLEPSGAAGLWVAGVEDAWRGTADMEAALAGRPEGSATVLLAHHPTVFPEAARREVGLTLSGHVHGGQIGVPFLAERLSLGRIGSRFSAGLLAEGPARLFVHAGLGTTGPAIRVGVAPEVVEIVLRRA
jgi:predicted MPP superfamily phosphohydrolase